MRIGIEAQRIFRKKKHGMDVYALELIKALQRMNTPHEWVVFVKPDEDPCLPSAPGWEIVEVPGKTYVDWEQVYLPKAVQKAQLDLLHLTSNTAPLRCPVPYLVTVHDIMYLTSFTGGSWYQTLGHYYRKWLVPKIVPKAQRVLTVSEFERQKMQIQWPHLSTRLFSVYNGIGSSFSCSEDSAMLERIRVQYGLPLAYLFYLGNEAPKKNMTRVLAAYKQYRQHVQDPLPLVVAELSVAQLLPYLSKIDAIGLLDHIVTPGYIQHAHLPYFYEMASVFIYPSLQESFGIPLIEAMACGSPVLSSNVTALPEVAGDAALLVDPLDVSALAQGMVRLTQDQALAEEFRKRGILRASSFAWEQTAQKTLQHYESI